MTSEWGFINSPINHCPPVMVTWVKRRQTQIKNPWQMPRAAPVFLRPFLLLPTLVRAKAASNNHPGRSSGFRIFLHPTPSQAQRPVAFCGFRPRLQRRDRAGFTPASLLNPSARVINILQTTGTWIA